MALVLSLKEGQDFFVGETRFVVDEIFDAMCFRLRRECGAYHLITDERAVEVLPQVFVSAGDNAPSTFVRAVIQAPRAIVVQRGKRRRQLVPVPG